MAEIKFYMDEHVALAITLGLRRRGVDAKTAQEAELSGADDVAHLEFATKEARVMVSQDSDFLALHKKGTAHAGIVYAPQQTPIGEIVRMLTLMHDVMEAEEMVGRVEFI